MIDIFGNEISNIWIENIELAPCRRYDKVLDGYWASKCAKIYSTKTNKWLTPNYRNKNSADPNKRKSFRLTIYVPAGTFEDYNHFSKHGTTCSLSCDLHQLVIDAWKPLDFYTHEIDPPITREEWINLPANARLIIRESLVIDHIESNDGTIECNRLDNLRRTTLNRNERNRKDASMSVIVGNELAPITFGEMVWNPMSQEYDVNVSFNGEEGGEMFDKLKELSEYKQEPMGDILMDILKKGRDEQNGTEALAELN